MKAKVLDIAERAAWTFVQTFVAFLITAEFWSAVDRVSVAKQAAAAGLAATLAVVKGLFGTLIGNRETASTLPASVDPATPGA
jgi:hypothetical protein